MTSYAKERNGVEFDWNAFFKKEQYSIEDIKIAEQKASMWTTCACGNQCAVIPRGIDGSPKDPDLLSLGYDFYSAIDQMLYFSIVRERPDQFEKWKKEAIILLSNIEKRSSELITQIKQSK